MSRPLPVLDLWRSRVRALAVSGTIHFPYAGLSLQAWRSLQRLIPLVEERIADGRLPLAAQTVCTAHPAFPDAAPCVATLDERRTQCL